MKSKRYLCGITILIMVILSACQPTPQKEIVIGKNDGKLENKVYATPALGTDSQETTDKNKETYQAPGKWEDILELKDLTCEINAKIVMPKTKTFPVIKVKQGQFDVNSVKELSSHFIDGANGMKETEVTLEELEESLIAAKRGTYYILPGESEGEYIPYEGQEEDIKELERQIAELEQKGEKPFKDELITSLPADVTYDMGEDKKIYLSAIKYRLTIQDFSSESQLLQFESMIADFASSFEPNGSTIDNVTITKEEAEREAIKLLADMNIEETKVKHIEKARIVTLSNGKPASEGWIVIMQRNYGKCIPLDLMGKNVLGRILALDREKYVRPWSCESISVYIDEAGVRMFQWEFPIEQVEELNSNVELLPFDDVKEAIKNVIKFGNGCYLDERKKIDEAGYGGDEISEDIVVDKMTLTNLMISIKDEPDYRMLVPAWLIEYTEEEDRFVFAINAITGANADVADVIFDDDF